MGDHSGHIAAMERFTSRAKEFSFYAKDLQLASEHEEVNGKPESLPTKGTNKGEIENVRDDIVDRGIPKAQNDLTSGLTQSELSGSKTAQRVADDLSDDMNAFFETDDRTTGLQLQDVGETIENDFGEAEAMQTTSAWRTDLGSKDHIIDSQEQLISSSPNPVGNYGYGACAANMNNSDGGNDHYSKGRLYPSLDDNNQ